MITDFRINAKGELEGKVIPPAKWEEMYTKEEVIAMLTEIQLEIEELQTYRLFLDSADVNELYISKKDISNLIQQKINALTEDKE